MLEDEKESEESSAAAKQVGRQLRTVHRMLNERAAWIHLNHDTHEYLVRRRDISTASNTIVRIPQSVTGALEELCGAFDADATITRMLNNKSRWRMNKLYQTCNFDAFGNELSRDQVAERIRNNWTESRDRGTHLHNYIEHRYAASSPSSTASSSAQQNQTAASSAATATTTSTSADKAPDSTDLAAYDNWETIRMFNDWLLVASEYPVYDLSCGLAGTIDAIYMPNAAYPRQVILVDWKRSIITTTVGNMFYEHPLLMRYAKGNYWKYAMQLNLYRELLERNYGLQVIEMYLVTFPPKSPNCEVYGVPKMLEAKTFVNALQARQREQQQQQQQHGGTNK